MPRAHRYFATGHIWHITQRCHKKEFLLKFKRDRERWLYWLFEAKKRFGLTKELMLVRPQICFIAVKIKSSKSHKDVRYFKVG